MVDNTTEQWTLQVFEAKLKEMKAKFNPLQVAPLTPTRFSQKVCEAIAIGFLNNPYNEDLLDLDRDCSCFLGNPDRVIRIDPEVVEMVLLAIESTISRIDPRGRTQAGAELAWTLDAVIKQYDQPIKPSFIIGKGMLMGVDASGYEDFTSQNNIALEWAKELAEKYSLPIWKAEVDNA